MATYLEVCDGKGLGDSSVFLHRVDPTGLSQHPVSKPSAVFSTDFSKQTNKKSKGVEITELDLRSSTDPRQPELRPAHMQVTI